MLANLRWYCQIRWIIVTIFLFLGAASFVPGLFSYFDLKGPLLWPLLCLVVLVAANSVFMAHIRYLGKTNLSVGLNTNLWTQVVLDLVVATVTVHQVGSLETTIPLAYFFHIVLSCIFLPRWQSLVVTLLAGLLFTTCVALELGGILPAAGILRNGALRHQIEQVGYVLLANTASTAIFWIVVWYLASYLSSLLMKLRVDLESTNAQLLAAQQERVQHMLHTTHELKAPFAAIHANTQLLLKGYCGPLQPDAQEVIQRIADRCRGLTRAIQEMLQLANLRSESEEPLASEKLDLAELLQWCVSQVEQVAEEHRVAIASHIEPVAIHGVEEHLKMLFLNVLTNAVLYSLSGGKVVVQCRRDGNGRAEVTIEDFGIGIPGDKLERIFKEYYRTNEAVQHNKTSTGLGLAIVKEIAQRHQIQIRVESGPDAGTKFIIHFAG